MSANDPIVIVGVARTPMGGFQGDFASLSASDLGARAIAAAVARSGVAADQVGEVIMGCVLPAGQGQAPARQAALGAGLSFGAGATTVNKMCGSGMKAVMFGHDLLLAGSANVLVAGGMESMTNAPYLLPRARAGYRMGHGQVIDHMFFDGLEDAYEKGSLMGAFADDYAREHGYSRQAQDDYAVASLQRAQKAIADGLFVSEIEPVTLRSGKSEVRIPIDEQPGKARLDRISTLRPAFREGGTVTAANSSSISDGAAALVLMRASDAERRGLKPRARIAGHVTFADRPRLFPVAPVGAMRMLSEKIGWSIPSVDLFEVNEAFAVVAMASMRELGLPRDKVNIHGGACALGHPIGASGARLLVTLLSALETHGLDRGFASLCIGGGEATAVAIERMH